MTLTIKYKNGEFTCTFTPEGESSIIINGADVLTASLENVGDQEEGSHEATAEDEESITGQKDHQAGAEEDPHQVEADDPPAPVSHMTEDQDNGRAVLAYGYPTLSGNRREIPLGVNPSIES